MTRAAAYIRVSTERQAEEDRVSLSEQQKDIETHCEQRGHTLVKEYKDVGSGASKRRPQFQQMLKDAQAGLFDVIVCWKSDRLSRGLYPAAALSEALEGTDIGLESVKDSIDRNTFDIMAVVGKIELGNIRERARMGARGRASKGLISGIPKYGYTIGQDSKPAIQPEEAEVVRQIFSWQASGIGSWEIARRLNAAGTTSSRKYTTSAGEQREETEWFNCSAFGKLADTCNQYLTKGKQVYVEGRLSSRTHQTQSGETRHSHNINVQGIQFLGKRGNTGSGNVVGAAEAAGHQVPDDDLDDLPF